MPDRKEVLAELFGAGGARVGKLSAAGRRILAQLAAEDAREQPDREGLERDESGPEGAPGAEGTPAPAGAGEPPSTPTPSEEPTSAPTPPTSTPPGPTPESVPQPAAGGAPRPRERCCGELIVRLERVRIKTLTTPRTFKDNVVIIGISSGTVMNPSPTPFAWPLDSDGDIEAADLDVGEERTDTPLVARVVVGRDCAIQLDCTLTYYEEDAEDIADLLDEAVRQATAMLAAKQGIVVPGPALGAIRRIIKEIARKLGLTNDIMGAYDFSVQGRLDCETDIDKLGWSPPWGTSYAHEKIDKDTARLKRTFKANGGEWETSILVQKICPDC